MAPCEEKAAVCVRIGSEQKASGMQKPRHECPDRLAAEGDGRAGRPPYGLRIDTDGFA